MAMTIIGVLAFALKVLGLLFVFIWVRWSIPRFRYDQLMNIGWNVAIPVGLAAVLVNAVIGMATKS